MNDQAKFWDERYGGEEFAFGTAPNGFLVLVSEAKYLKLGMRAFVPGDGEGQRHSGAAAVIRALVQRPG